MLDVPSAKYAKANLRVLVICKLAAPWTKSKEVRIAPTRDSPFEKLSKYRGLVVEILELWFYDPSTGKIYYKQTSS